MTNFEYDCRCSVCDCCKHDHNGWQHEWTPREEEQPDISDYASFPQRYILGFDQSPRETWERQARLDMDRIVASGEDLSQEPDEWGYDDDGKVVDLRGH